MSHGEAGITTSADPSTGQLNEKKVEFDPTTGSVHPPTGQTYVPTEQAYLPPGQTYVPSGQQYQPTGWDNSQNEGWTYPQTGYYYSSGPETQASGYEFQTVEDVVVKSPREGMPEWKWKGLIVLLVLTGVVYGYDISNMANIQSPVYQAMGHIELLPCAVLSYSMANFAIVLLVRKITAIFNIRTIFIISVIIFTVGSIVCGAAKTMNAIIIGRFVTGLGGCGAYQLCMAYASILARPNEVPMIMGLLGMAYSIGIISGPVIGGAFAENHGATWRWAFYINAPYVAVLLVLVALFMPGYTAPSNVRPLTRLARIDWVGFVLHAGTVILFPLALTFGGISWDWDSGSTIAFWVVWGVVLIAYIIQQHFCLLTTPEDRIFPVYLFKNRVVGPVAIANSTVLMAHPVALYYLPLFYAFARGHHALGAAVRLLPYICVSIASSLLSGAALKRIGRYSLFFLFSGALFLVGGVLVTRVKPTTPEGTVMGYSSLVGFGVGLTLPHGFTIANTVLPTVEQRLDAAAMFVMTQLGTTSTTLAIAGAVFQNVGFRLLKDAVRDSGTSLVFADKEIREALSGVVSRIFHSGDAKLAELSIRAVTTIITRLFYITVGAGALCMLATLFMGWQRLDFGATPGEKTEPEAQTEARTE